MACFSRCTVPVIRNNCLCHAVWNSWLISSISNLQNCLFSSHFFTDPLKLWCVNSSGVFPDGGVIPMFLLSYNTDTSAGADTVHFIVCLTSPSAAITPASPRGIPPCSLYPWVPLSALYLQPKSLCLELLFVLALQGLHGTGGQKELR